MSGSTLAAFVVPAVALPILFLWIGAVFYADSHPGWRVSGNERRAAGPSHAVPGQRALPRGGARGPVTREAR